MLLASNCMLWLLISNGRSFLVMDDANSRIFMFTLDVQIWKMAIYGNLPEFFPSSGVFDEWLVILSMKMRLWLAGALVSLCPLDAPPPLSGPPGFLSVIPPPLMMSHLALTWMRFSGQGLWDMGSGSHPRAEATTVAENRHSSISLLLLISIILQVLLHPDAIMLILYGCAKSLVQ